MNAHKRTEKGTIVQWETGVQTTENVLIYSMQWFYSRHVVNERRQSESWRGCCDCVPKSIDLWSFYASIVAVVLLFRPILEKSIHFISIFGLSFFRTNQLICFAWMKIDRAFDYIFETYCYSITFNIQHFDIQHFVEIKEEAHGLLIKMDEFSMNCSLLCFHLFIIFTREKRHRDFPKCD